jgi:glutamate-5-semialdehyde dehydrogenase
MLNNYFKYFENAKTAAKASVAPSLVNLVLTELATAIIGQTAYLLDENQKDLERMDPADPKYDRLKLTDSRIADMAKEINMVVTLANPLGLVLSQKEMPNGLNISKISVPLGVVGVIYEARPNVTLDVFTLCFKSGNVCLLKGGSDADHSNKAIISVIHQVLTKFDINIDMAIPLPPDRDAAEALLNAIGYVDVLIPRGSQQLIDYVRQNSKVPVIETGAGIVHTYFDEFGDVEKGRDIILNAKTRRVSVCNALDCLLIHHTRISDLPTLIAPLADKNVELYADEVIFEVTQNFYPRELVKKAKPEHYGTEFLSLKMALKIVHSLEDALEHISVYSSKHSEAIISESEVNTEKFLRKVDAAAVYVNASTAFTDGGQFGLGAEIGISTQKLHARGPMGLSDLTSYKWIIRGNGQIRQ